MACLGICDDFLAEPFHRLEGVERDAIGRRLIELGQDRQQRHRDEEDGHPLDEPHQQLAAGAVVGEAVALQLALAQQVAAHAGLGPEVEDARREQREQRVHRLDAEEPERRAVEAQPQRRGRARDWNRRRGRAG